MKPRPSDWFEWLGLGILAAPFVLVVFLLIQHLPALVYFLTWVALVSGCFWAASYLRSKSR